MTDEDEQLPPEPGTVRNPDLGMSGPAEPQPYEGDDVDEPTDVNSAEETEDDDEEGS